MSVSELWNTGRMLIRRLAFDRNRGDPRESDVHMVNPETGEEIIISLQDIKGVFGLIGITTKSRKWRIVRGRMPADELNEILRRTENQHGTTD